MYLDQWNETKGFVGEPELAGIYTCDGDPPLTGVDGAHSVKARGENNLNLIRSNYKGIKGCSGISGGGGPVVGVSPISNHRLTRTRGSNQGGSARSCERRSSRFLAFPPVRPTRSI